MSSFPESIFTDSLNNLGRVYIYVFSEIALSLSVLEILLQFYYFVYIVSLVLSRLNGKL